MQHLFLQIFTPCARITPRRAALLIALFALLMGCGGGDSVQDPVQNSSDSANNAREEQMSDAGYRSDATAGSGAPDAANDFDASTDQPDSNWPESESSYDPSLDQAEGPASSCVTERVGPDARAPVGARVFVPSYRVDFDALDSHQSYREHIHQWVRAQVLPCLPEQGASLVVFPEAMSLPMLLVGPKAESARQMQDASRALSTMIAAVPDAYAYYGEKYPDTSVNSRFMLAMTDPLVRATYDTFGQLAARYQLYLSVSVTLPDFKRVAAPEKAARLADPDISAPDYAYEADSPKLYSRQLLFGPDGELVDETYKNYLSPMGREQLGLSDAPLSTLHTFASPWGASAVTLSDAALMPDIQDRLDDLGARVILQPTAMRGGWATANDDAETWQPDRFMLGAYNLAQRSPRVARTYVSQLTGHFFEILFDGQVQIAADAHAYPQQGAFIGQDNASAGNLFIGPWVVEDPSIANPEWSLDQRRAKLRETGERLAPGVDDPFDAGPVEGVWSNDLSAAPEDPGEVQTHPVLVAASERVYLATSQGKVGQRALRLQVFNPSADHWDIDDSDLDGSAAQAHSADALAEVPGYDLVRPAMAASEDAIHIVAELIQDDANRLVYFVYNIQEQRLVGDPKIIDTQLVGQRAYHPAIEVSGDVLNMTWVQEINGVNRAYFAQTSLAAPFSRLSVRTEIARRSEEAMALPDNHLGATSLEPPASQWDARLAVTPSAIAVTWLNYRAGNWELLAAASVDGGLSWSRAIRVDLVPEHEQALNATPTITALERRRFAIAWTDARATRPSTRVGVATFNVGSNGAIHMPRPARLLDESPEDDAINDVSRWFWRPTIVSDPQNISVYYEALQGSERSIKRAQFNGEDILIRSDTISTTAGAGGYFPTAASTYNGVFIAYEELAPEEIGGSHARVIRAVED